MVKLNFSPMKFPAQSDLRSHLTELIRAALPAGAAQIANLTIALERPKQAQHGDYACNVAMQLAKALRQPPRAIADSIVAALAASPYLDKAAVAGAGFINLFLKPAAIQQVIQHILAARSEERRVGKEC